MSKKNTLKKILNTFLLTVVLSFLLVAIILFIIDRVSSNKNDLLIEKQIYGADFLSSAYSLVDELELKGIYVDDDYKSSLAEYGLEIVSVKTDISLPFETVAQLIFIDSHLEGKNIKRLNKKLALYFDNDNKLLASFPYNTFEKLDIEKNKSDWVYKITSVAKYLDYSGSYITDYNINKGLVSYYNKILPKLDGMTETERNFSVKALVGIYRYFLESDQLDLIDHTKLKPYINDDIMEKLNAVDNRKNTESLLLIAYSHEVSNYKNLFENDFTYEKLPQEIFNQIDSIDDMGNIQSSDFTESALVAIKPLSNATSNIFFTENINSYLKQNFVYCAK